jgi:preprotein translocase subunit SecD
MNKTRMSAILLLLLGVLVGYFVYSSEKPGATFYKPFKLGLDLSGGSHLVYQADTSKIKPADVNSAMESLRGVIERRVNVFGVTEPIIQIEKTSFGQGGGADKLVVDLPGVTDVKQAAALIKATPILEFKIERPAGPEKDAITAAWKDAQDKISKGVAVDESNPLLQQDPNFISTPLTGRFLSRSTLQLDWSLIAKELNYSEILPRPTSGKKSRSILTG